MGDEHVHKQEFLVRDLSTTSVMFFPTRANIVREIKDVALRPGANELTIHGLTPTADENSIKVDGKGSATITDTVVEMVLNPDRYEDVYPSDSEENAESDDESESEDESEQMKDLNAKEDRIVQDMKKVQEEKASASKKLDILETYGKSVQKDRPLELTDRLSTYEQERRKAFEVYHASENENDNLMKQRKEVAKKRKKFQLNAWKVKAKAAQAKQKHDDKKFREREKQLQAKRQLKIDRLKFWPKKVYKITVGLDSLAELTPASSRRGSVSSFTKAGSESTDSYVSLSISYITHAATWSPRYDLNLNTPSSNGNILYRAEFSNTTSETWKNAKITLSTSQTAFQGLGEALPQMQPWRIDLAKGASGGHLVALRSHHESQCKGFNAFAHTQKATAPRGDLFGLDNIDAQMQQMLSQQQTRDLHVMQQKQNLHGNNNAVHQHPGGVFGSNNNNVPLRGQTGQAPAAAGGLFGSINASKNSNTGGSLFGSTNTNTFGGLGSAMPGSGSEAAPAPLAASSASGAPARPSADKDQLNLPDGDVTDDGATIIPDIPPLDTLESSWSESGLTMSYDIPALRTIAPSFSLRRHRISSINLREIHLSHVVVPKLQAAAFLKARLKNTSSVSLLRGPIGVTLDGSFLGNTILPRCSTEQTISLSLGVDPCIGVSYGKPTVQKSQSGILNKDTISVFTRTCTVTNTKPNHMIEGLLLEQVPVSNDERLRVEVLQPRGLKREGDSARSGTGVTAAGKEDPKWGKATAQLKKAGEIRFDFKIEGGKGVRFVVEYETKHPSMEQILSV